MKRLVRAFRGLALFYTLGVAGAGLLASCATKLDPGMGDDGSTPQKVRDDSPPNNVPVLSDASSASVRGDTKLDAGANLDGSMCQLFRDDSPPSDVPVISVVNTGSVPLYLQQLFTSCENPGSLFEVRRDGEVINVEGTGHQIEIDGKPLEAVGPGDCSVSCQRVLEAGLGSLGGDSRVGCPPGDCSRPSPVLLEPGQTRSQAARLEVVARNLPSSCAAGIADDFSSCVSLAIPPPGAYTLTVSAGLSLDCSSATDCDCHPNADGACTNPSVRLSDAPLTFTFSTPSYYQSQSFSIVTQ
jgi:hypothetical protein